VGLFSDGFNAALGSGNSGITKSGSALKKVLTSLTTVPVCLGDKQTAQKTLVKIT